MFREVRTNHIHSKERVFMTRNQLSQTEEIPALSDNPPQKQLTISVAAYNVEAYLDQLMESIIRSNVIDQLEILIINDGSVDRTSELGEAYQNRYPQSVRLINKKNGGHGSTINRGIQEATGRYFRALDGDDWIDSQNLARLITRINSINADIILSNYRMCPENGKTEDQNDFPELKDGDLYRFDEIWHPGFWMRYHTVIYRTDILKAHNILLDENCFYVDTEFMLYPVPFVNTIYYAKDILYCYRVGIEGQSVSDNGRKKNIAHSDRVGRNLIGYYNAHKETLSEQKKQYYRDEILFHCKWHEESLFLFPLKQSHKQQFVDFEIYVRKHMPEVFETMGQESKLLRMLRQSGYCLYCPAVLYRKVKARIRAEG